MKVAFALLVVLGTACARPEVAVERKFDFDGAPQQQIAPEYDTASLPSIPLPNAAVPVLMYFPEYNAILVPAESISPDYLPSTKRRKPMRGLVKLIKEKMESDRSAESSENASIASQKAILTSSPENAPSRETESGEEPINAPTTKMPNDFLMEEDSTTTVPPEPAKIQSKTDGSQANTFGPFAQFFNRPNRPFLTGGGGQDELNAPSFPQDEAGVQIQDPVPSQPSRPTLVSFLPAGVTSYFQNPPKLPFSNFFENRFPFLAPGTSPRNPYVHYYTRTPTSEAFYYNSLHPSMRQAAYSDAVQSEISDYVNQVQQSLLQEQDISAPTSPTSAMMVASVPMGKNQATSLILRPVAKAVAGPKGVAVASPVAKAVLRKGEKVDIDFDPDAVAIAGPGGQAHAHPKLIISYANDKSEESAEKPSKS